MDPTTVDVPVPDYVRSLKTPTAKLRLVIPRMPFFENLDPEVAKAVDAALDVSRKVTAGAKDVKLPPGGNPGALWTPEAYAYHAQWIAESPGKYQPSTRAALQRGADFKAVDYIRARNEVERLRREIKAVFADVDLLITPTMLTPAPRRRSGRGRSQHIAVRCVWHPHDLDSVRLFSVRPADRASDQRGALGRRVRARTGPRLRAGNGLAHAAAAALARVRQWTATSGAEGPAQAKGLPHKAASSTERLWRSSAKTPFRSTLSPPRPESGGPPLPRGRSR